MRLQLAILIGRLVRVLAKMRGGGSAIPGRLALILEPRFLGKTLGSLKHGVVFVSGSNGKSTTTALVTATLRSQGLKVFSNPSGGNMPQGIASAVIGQVRFDGILDADIAVLEVDEAYGEVLAQYFLPSYVVLTNIQIDQLNRFFEPERVFGMLQRAATFATRGVIINGSDENLVELVNELPTEIRVSQVKLSEAAAALWPQGALAAPRFGHSETARRADSTVTVERVDGDSAIVLLNGDELELKLPGKGLHFAIDAALAIAAASEVAGENFNGSSASEHLSRQETVYGRGEVATYKGVEIQILMMKNPSSMRATLAAMDKPQAEVWVAMDEGTPDPSWIFDIDLSPIGNVRTVSGSRCWHWATRLCYSDIACHEVIPNSKNALESYVEYIRDLGVRGTLITNYEQMMAIRKHMGFMDLESGN